MSPFDQIVIKIIEEQALVIGPLAWSEAEKVSGLNVNHTSHAIHFSSTDQMQVIDKLVAQYERLFGKASHEVCREAVAALIKDMTPSDVPSSLR